MSRECEENQHCAEICDLCQELYCGECGWSETCDCSKEYQQARKNEILDNFI